MYILSYKLIVFFVGCMQVERLETMLCRFCYGFFTTYSGLCLHAGGETEDEKIRVDIMENQAMDFRNGFVMMCYTDFVSPGQDNGGGHRQISII